VVHRALSMQSLELQALSIVLHHRSQLRYAYIHLNVDAGAVVFVRGQGYMGILCSFCSILL